MARRVNRNFVIVLVVALAGLGGAVAWFVGLPYLRGHDPVYVAEQARQAAARGDLDLALTEYNKAAGLAARARAPQAADYYAKAADLCYQTSDKDAARYGQALQLWRQALLQRPGDREVQERLMKELYSYANLGPDLRVWAEVEKESANMLNLDPNDGLAHAYHAEAVRRQATADDLTGRAKREAASVELEEAIKLAKDDPTAYISLAFYHTSEARALEAQGRDAAVVQKERDKAGALLKGFLATHPKNLEAWLALGQMYLDFGGTSAEALAASRKAALDAFQKAVEMWPNDPKAYAALAKYYFYTNNPTEAEQSIRQMIAMEPKAMEPYVWLANFYRITGQLDKAEQACKDALSRKDVGLGVEAVRSQIDYDAMQYTLTLVCLDLAEMRGVTTREGKAAIQEAEKNVDLLQRQRPNDPRLSFFDGYLLLLHGRVAEAQMTLAKADELYSANKRLDPDLWYRTKMLLARAYELVGQPGSSIILYKQITDSFPGKLIVWLRRGRLENQLGNFGTALMCAQMVLNTDPTNVDARQLMAVAFAGQGDTNRADEIWKTLGTPEAVLRQAQMQLINGDAQGALDATAMIDDPNNERALAIAASAKGQLADQATDPKQKEQLRASALADVAKLLSKHPDDIRLKWLQESLANPATPREKRFEKVISELSDPYDQAIAWYQYYVQAKDPDKQLEYLEKAAKLRDTAEGPVDAIFQLALSMKKWDLADEYAQKAAQINIDGVHGKLYQGRLLLAKGEKSQALQILQQAVTERPGFSMAHTTLAMAYMEMGRKDQALSELNIAIVQMPNNVWALKAIIGLLVSQSDSASLAQAKNNLDAALRYAPNDPQLKGYRDLIGDPTEVIRIRMPVYEQNPKDYENTRGLTIALVRAGRLDDAIKVFKPVYDADPTNLGNADALARLYRDAHQEDNAMKIYQKFLVSDDPQVKFLAMLRQGDMLVSLGKGPEAAQIYLDAHTIEPKGDNEAERRLADLYFDMEDFAHAEQLYKGISEAAGGKDIVVLRRYIETLIRERKFDEADALLADRILKANPDDPEGLVLSGYSLLQRGEGQKAIACFDRILSKDPDNPDALHYRAAARSAMQTDLPAAITDLLRVRSIRPNAVNSRLLLARVYRQNRNYSEAVKEYGDVLKIAPDYAPARLEFVGFLFTLTEAAQRIPADASDPFPRMLRDIKPAETLGQLLAESAQRFPNQPIWQIREGDLLMMLGQREQAATVYRQIMDATGENPVAGTSYVGALVELKQYDRAVQVATALIGLNQNFADLYIKRARAYAGKNMQAEALADFDQALQLASRDLASFLSVVHQLYAALPSNVSIPHLEARLKQNPQDLATRIGLTQVYLTADQAKEAEDAVLPLLSDKRVAPIRTEILRMAALACYGNREFDKALGYYDELLKVAPSDLETLNNVAYLLANDMQPPQPKRALAYAERSVNALQMQPQEIVYVNNGNVFDTRGWCRYLAGDVAGAQVDLRFSLQTDPLPVTYYHLGMILQKLNRLGEAKRMFESCVQLGGPKKDPAVPLAAEQLKQLAGG